MTTSYLEKLTPELIRGRMNFWGYGSLDAPTWLIGMEEGGALEYMHARFLSTYKHSMIDMRADTREVIDHARWFTPTAPIQATWKYPIAFFLYLQNSRLPTKDEIREFQRERLGDTTLRETAVIELMPMPSNKAHEAHWLYGSMGIPELGTRAGYIKKYKPVRLKQLRSMLDKHRPRLVLFYSLSYLPDWKDVIGVEPEEVTKDMYFAKRAGTAYCITPHSVAHGMSYTRLYEFADKVRSRLP